jgi:hypothetical protein
MHITTSAEKFQAIIEKWLDEIIAKRTAEIVAGVPVDAYKERCAELRTYSTVRQELPKLLRKAKE